MEDFNETKIIHQTINGKYRVVFEQAASTKGVIGFKVEANGDDLTSVQTEAEIMLVWAKGKAPNIGAEVR
jgi:ribosomal protein S3